VRVEVWEPGKDMASVAMTMPKKALDYMHAFSLKSRVALGHNHYFDMNEIWGRIQRLPTGEKLHIHDFEGHLSGWIEEEGTPGDRTGGAPGELTRAADL